MPCSVSANERLIAGSSWGTSNYSWGGNPNPGVTSSGPGTGANDPSRMGDTQLVFSYTGATLLNGGGGVDVDYRYLGEVLSQSRAGRAALSLRIHRECGAYGTATGARPRAFVRSTAPARWRLIGG